MKSAAALVKALSRPTSQKSGAWSTKDPEKGKSAEEVAKEKEMKLQKKKNQLEALLEEELDEDKGKGPEPVGCWSKITTTILKIWSTTDLLTGEETEERVRTTTRELAIYMVFMGVLCWVTLSATHVTMFQYTSQLKNLFKSQEEVVQVADFWNFMENDFLDGLYWEEWYNDGTLRQKFPCEEGQGLKGWKAVDFRRKKEIFMII